MWTAVIASAVAVAVVAVVPGENTSLIDAKCIQRFGALFPERMSRRAVFFQAD